MLPARMASFGAVLAAMAVLLSAVNVQGQQLAVNMTASFPGAVDRISVLMCAYSASDQDNFTLSYISPNGSVGVTTFTDLDSSMGNRNFTVTVMIGTYYCVLNDTEDTQYNASVTLNAPSVSIAPSPSITVTAGQSRTLQCTSTGAFASLAWTLNNGAPLPGNAMQTSMSSVSSQPVSVNLSLSHLNESVSFRCTATGGLGTSSANTSVIVIGPPTVASFPNSDFNESQTIELPCGVLSDPVSIVTFTLNTVNGSDSQELSNDSSRVSIMPLGTGNGLRLVITNATVKDTGNYTCTAVNQAGTGALTASVNVFTLPRVSLQPPDVEHRINASSEFAVTCRAVGFREPTISWQDDAEYSLHTLSSIPVDAFQVEARSKLNTTDFMGSRKNYSVTCVGSNAAGSQMASTTIIVQGVPEMVNLSVAKDMASQGLRFSWVPGSNGNIPSSSSITYVLTASFNNASRMQTEELHRGSNSLSVLVPFTTLVPNTDYQFFVVAMNFIGRSSQSNIVRNRTPEAVPSAPVNLRLVPINPRSIKVTWDKPREANGVITNYTVEFSGTTQEHRSYCAPMGGMFVNVTSTELRNATLTGLCPFTRYDVFVGAINGAGRGQRVNNSVMTPATNASPPRNLTATVSRDTSGPHWDATLSWSRPEFQNGMFSQYLIEYTLMGACNLASTDGTSQLASTNTTTTTSITTTIMLSFLHANSNYSFVVRQSNGESLPGEKAVFSTCTGFSAPASGGIAQPAMASNTGMPEQTSTTLLFSLVQPSQQNGPISFCQVLALETDGSSDSTQNPDDIYSNAVTDVTEYDRTRSEPPSSTPWVAAEFELKFFRNLFTLGNPNMYNSNASMRYNGPLKPSTAYRIALRCFIAPNTRSKRAISTIPPRDYTLFASSDFSLSLRTSAAPAASSGIGSGAVAGIVVAMLLLLVAILAAALLVKYYLSSKREAHIRDGTGASVISMGSKRVNNVSLRRDSKTVEPDYISPSPIGVDEFASHVQMLHANDNYHFSQEYDVITAKSPQPPYEVCGAPENRNKNRYANILCYDHSRVILSQMAEDETDTSYVNANYIDGYKDEKAYIATQGPVPDSIEDFWRMVWEEDVHVIVMLTNLEERGRLKCNEYWPNAGSEKYGQFNVHHVDTTALSDSVERTFSLEKRGSNRSREVRQFHFSSWPDHGVPDQPTPLLNFMKRVRASMPPTSGPMVVHCSAGVGRTGTYIVIETQLMRIKAEKTIDVFNFLQHIRTQRNFMVQTEVQYVFVHDAILEAISTPCTEVNITSFQKHYAEVLNADQPADDAWNMKREFEHLNESTQSDMLCKAGNETVNRKKNRSQSHVPIESTRVKLRVIPGIVGSDYINASYVNGYIDKNAYIVTQAPIKDTVNDFWRMVWEQCSHNIVMLTNLEEGGEEKCILYWPDEGKPTLYGDYLVSKESESQYGDIVVRELLVTCTKQEETISRQLQHFQCTAWPSGGKPSSAADIIQMLGQIQKVQQATSNRSIVLHCSSGTGRTGVFCALSICLERVKSDGVLDVYQTVKSIRGQRPGLVATLDQYRFIYESILQYLDSFEMYSNFK